MVKNEEDVDERKIAVFKISLARALCWVHLSFLKSPGVFVLFCVFLNDIPQSIGRSINFTIHAS